MSDTWKTVLYSNETKFESLALLAKCFVLQKTCIARHAEIHHHQYGGGHTVPQ